MSDHHYGKCQGNHTSVLRPHTVFMPMKGSPPFSQHLHPLTHSSHTHNCIMYCLFQHPVATPNYQISHPHPHSIALRITHAYPIHLHTRVGQLNHTMYSFYCTHYQMQFVACNYLPVHPTGWQITCLVERYCRHQCSGCQGVTS